MKRVVAGATLSNNSIQVIHIALAKYGLNNFKFEIIEEIDTREDANNSEEYWISYHDTLNSGYNCTRGGYFGGYEHSEEAKEYLSKYWQNITHRRA